MEFSLQASIFAYSVLMRPTAKLNLELRTGSIQIRARGFRMRGKNSAAAGPYDRS